MDQNAAERKGMDNQHRMNKINKILASLPLLAEPESQTIDIPKQNEMKQNKRRDMHNNIAVRAMEKNKAGRELGVERELF